MSDYPILQTKGLKLRGIEVIEGHLIITLVAPPSTDIESPIVLDIGADLSSVTFRYAIHDRSTNTVRKYQGRAADPDVDPYVIEGV